jgi:glutathione synthase/RimK-type ligase-like ATP-grasp enzyme
LIDQRKCFVLNNPKGLREANEKLYALRFPEQIPQTMVERQHRTTEKLSWPSWAARMIVKPLDGCGGSGVFLFERARPQYERHLGSGHTTMADGWSWVSVICRKFARGNKRNRCLKW